MKLEQMATKNTETKGLSKITNIENSKNALSPKLKEMILEKFTAKGFDVEFTELNQVRLSKNGKKITTDNKTLLEMMEKN